MFADAASVADGNLDDLLGGDWNITGRRAWHDQACAELEARLAYPRVPWEGIAAKRWEAPNGNHGPDDDRYVAGRIRRRRQARHRPRMGGAACVAEHPGGPGDARAGLG